MCQCPLHICLVSLTSAKPRTGRKSIFKLLESLEPQLNSQVRPSPHFFDSLVLSSTNSSP